MAYEISMIKQRKLRTVKVKSKKEALTVTRILRGQGIKSVKMKKLS